MCPHSLKPFRGDDTAVVVSFKFSRTKLTRDFCLTVRSEAGAREAAEGKRVEVTWGARYSGLTPLMS